jgi:hypothetical protein
MRSPNAGDPDDLGVYMVTPQLTSIEGEAPGSDLNRLRAFSVSRRGERILE